MRHGLLLMCSLVLLLSPAGGAAAGDFDWLEGLNVTAVADPSGFRARLAARFNLGDVQLTAILSSVERPADAYMVLRLGEISARPTAYVIERYKAGKGQGWGVLAQSLGIAPGSDEFHALKRGEDLHGGDHPGQGKEKEKEKEKGQGQGRGKGKD